MILNGETTWAKTINMYYQVMKRKKKESNSKEEIQLPDRQFTIPRKTREKKELLRVGSVGVSYPPNVSCFEKKKNKKRSGKGKGKFRGPRNYFTFVRNSNHKNKKWGKKMNQISSTPGPDF